MGWAYVAVVFVVTLATRLLTLRVRPDLIQKRDTSFSRADTKTWDKVLVSLLAGVCPISGSRVLMPAWIIAPEVGEIGLAA